jgi:Na+/melibiose symporter-like transporter
VKNVAEEYRLSFKTKFAYLCGDWGMCLMNYMIIDYFVFYCTNMIGLSLATAGMIFFVARIWDAANDLLVGWAVDKTETKVGKARPWIKWFCGPCAFATGARASSTFRARGVIVWGGSRSLKYQDDAFPEWLS